MSVGPVFGAYMAIPDQPRVVAVVVTYRPELDALASLLGALSHQVAMIVLVDNGSEVPVRTWLQACSIDNLEVLFLDDNHGLAAAQNLGIAKARDSRADFVLLSDQDSLPEADMVSRLLAAAMRKLREGVRLAAVGPRYYDVNQNSVRPFVRVRGIRVRRFDCKGLDELVEVDHLIASGMLIPMSALAEIGGMVEELFIDYVDTEWSLRAWRLGYHSFGVCDACMRHCLGEEPNYFLGRYIPIHGPLRHYYLFRNAVWLYKREWIPMGWKIATAKRLLLKSMYFTLFSTNRRAHLGMMLKGLADGLGGRMGRFGG